MTVDLKVKIPLGIGVMRALAIVDYGISARLKIAADLLNYADAVLTLPPHPSLPRPVDSHPDMLLWNCGSKVITYGDYLTVAKDVFETLEGMGYNVLTASQYPADKYPRDVSLNCAVIGRNIICNKKTQDFHLAFLFIYFLYFSTNLAILLSASSILSIEYA